MIAKSKLIWWTLVFTLYITFLFYFSFILMAKSRGNIAHNAEMIQILMERKEYHIKVSEDNNKLLRSLLEELQVQRPNSLQSQCK